MERRLILITLGVADLHRARSFYEQLGCTGQEVQETVFFQAGGLAVGLWSRENLAADVGAIDHTAGGFGGIVLDHNVRSPAEVDQILSAARAAGATITRQAAKTSYGGYAGALPIWTISHCLPQLSADKPFISTTLTRPGQAHSSGMQTVGRQHRGRNTR